MTTHFLVALHVFKHLKRYHHCILEVMGDEFQECNGCKLVKQVDIFDGFKTCKWCREHSRRYREKNEDEINKEKRENITKRCI